MLRIGLIGAGTLGTAYAEALRRLPDVTLQAVADPDPAQALKLAEPLGIGAQENMEALLSHSDVDAVLIAGPTPSHFAEARAALQAGKHLFVEVPMTRTLREAQELAALAKEVSAVVTVAQTQRFYPEYQLMKQQVEQGAVGKPGMIRLSRRTPHPGRWYAEAQSGGVIFEAMIHELDYLQWVFGPVKRVYCQAMRGRGGKEGLDYALASLRLESGAIAHVESSWCHYGEFILEAEIAGDQGLIQYSNEDCVPLRFSEIDPARNSRHYTEESPVSEPAYQILLRRFIDAVQGKGDNPVPVEEGVRAVQLALATLQSAESGKPVELAGLAAV